MTFVFIVLTSLGISGTSLGYYHKLLHGSNANNPGLIYGSPKSIRSDEFLIFSPTTALQAQTGYPRFNESIGSGRDVSIIPEAPIKDWVGIFRPHNFGYFFLPFANAFAFSWWFGLLALVVSSYLFFMRILDKKKLLSILISTAFALSPFILWWYQVSVLMSLACFFMAALVIMRMVKSERVTWVKSQALSDALHVLALVYVGACMGLLLYVPFLIPIFIVLVFFFAGFIIDGIKSKDIKIADLKKASKLTGIAVILVVLVGVAFYFDRREMISTVMNSEYPGDRKTSSGELPFPPLYRLSESFLMPLLAKPPTGAFYTNQSEASNFILLLPFLLIPGVLIQIYDYVKRRNISWTLLSIQLLAVLFIARISLPFADNLYKILLLDRVPNNRLMIGLGLLGILQLVYLIKYIPKVKIPKGVQDKFALLFSVLTLCWLLVFSKYHFSEYLNLAHTWWLVSLLAALFASMIGAFLWGRKYLGATILLVFTLFSGFRVMPLQMGQNFIENERITNKIREVSSPSQSWAVVDNFTFESIPIMAGRKLINGRHPYADLQFWQQIDTEKKHEYIYNRQGHVVFVTNTTKPSVFLPSQFASINGDLELVKGNAFKVKFSCNEFTYKNIDFVLTTNQLELDCLDIVDNVEYPKATFFIYKINQKIK